MQNNEAPCGCYLGDNAPCGDCIDKEGAYLLSLRREHKPGESDRVVRAMNRYFPTWGDSPESD